MAVLKKNRSLWIFRLSISNHGILFFLLFTLHGLPYVTAQFRTVPPGPLPDDEFNTQGPTFNPKMAIVMVVLISVFFLMGYCSVYFRQCYQRRSHRSDGEPYAVFLRGTNYLSRRITRGLDASVINTFPTFLYSTVKGLKIGKGSLECAVCLNEFEDDETLRLIPKCSHVFHTDCIDAWLASHHTCPVCRANLVPQPGEIASSIIQVFDTDNRSGESEWSSNDREGNSRVEDSRDVESQEVNLMNQNRPPRKSKSTGWRLAGLFPRSHSTGHSLVQPGENCERFTLILPAEVRNELMNSNLTRSKSCVVLPRERSTRRGFRSGSGRIGSLNYERFDRSTRSGRRGFRIPNVCDEVTCTEPNLQDRSHNNVGDRSFKRLPPVQSTE